jgi:hypothetical protein
MNRAKGGENRHKNKRKILTAKSNRGRPLRGQSEKRSKKETNKKKKKRCNLPSATY